MDANVNGLHAALIILTNHLNNWHRKKKDWLETTEPKILLMRAFKLNYFDSTQKKNRCLKQRSGEKYITQYAKETLNIIVHTYSY